MKALLFVALSCIWLLAQEDYDMQNPLCHQINKIHNFSIDTQKFKLMEYQNYCDTPLDTTTGGVMFGKRYFELWQKVYEDYDGNKVPFWFLHGGFSMSVYDDRVSNISVNGQNLVIMLHSNDETSDNAIRLVFFVPKLKTLGAYEVINQKDEPYLLKFSSQWCDMTDTKPICEEPTIYYELGKSAERLYIRNLNPDALIAK